MPYGIAIPDLITWLLFVIVNVASFTIFTTKYATKVNEHEKLLYDSETGQINMVSFDAMEQAQKTCRITRKLRCSEITKDLKALQEDVKEHDESIKEIDKCLTVMNYKLSKPCADI